MISGNPFTWNRVFDCAWKIEFSGKLFTLTWKIFSTSVLPSSHFQRRAKRERERERTHRCANREREREIAPSSSRSSRSDRRPRPLHVTVRSRHEPTNWLTHLVHRWDHAMNPRTDRPTSSIGEIATRTHEPIDPSLILTDEPTNRSRHDWSCDFDFFFLLIFVSCVVYMLQLFVIIFVWILRKCEKHDKNEFSRAFSAKQQNTKKYFPKYFLECNQTLENIFLSQKYFQIFTWKYFILEKYFTFNKFNQTQPKSLIYWESDKK